MRKKSSIVLASVVAVLAAVAIAAGVFGFPIGNLLRSLVSPDRGRLFQMATQFMEDLQYKDFKKSARYHHRKDQKRIDIGRNIERLFKVKPELLDVREYRVKKVTFDSSRKRARVYTWARVKLLNTRHIRNVDMILYFFKHTDGKWYMRLDSSLVGKTYSGKK